MRFAPPADQGGINKQFKGEDWVELISQQLSIPPAGPFTGERYHRSMARLGTALSWLNPTEREVLRKRHGLDDGHPKSQRVVGEALGFSRHKVGRIEKRAMAKIRTQTNPK